MKKRVGVITYDAVLYNKIRLILRKDADVMLISSDDAPEGFDLMRSNCQHPLDHQKSKRVPEKHLFLLY